MTSEWKTIDQPLPDGTKFVVFVDAERRLACFAPRKELMNWRHGIVFSFLLRLGLVRPKPTHWIALPDLPEAQA